MITPTKKISLQPFDGNNIASLHLEYDPADPQIPNMNKREPTTAGKIHNRFNSKTMRATFNQSP
jgi:hypothetical protein